MYRNNKMSAKKKFQPFEPFAVLIFIIIFFGFIGGRMGLGNMVKTIMTTTHNLLINTAFYIMGVTVITGAFSKLMVEFGVVNLLEKIFFPLMRPLFNLPGCSALAGIMAFFSDNPAVIALAHDKKFKKNFKPYELVSLTNFGTAYGMGMIVVAFMATLNISKGNSSIQNFFWPAIIGLAGAVCGSIISTRLMQLFTRKEIEEGELPSPQNINLKRENDNPSENNDPFFLRFLNAMLDGGKSGVDLGLQIIPGVLVITTMIMLLTNGKPLGGYTGGLGEGVPVLPTIAAHFSIIFKYCFGFENPKLVAFPITSLGSVGAALGMVKTFLAEKIIGGNEIAVFTAMGMCWSGYLSTHTAMLDTLGYRKITTKAIYSHTIGGLCAGIAAHFIFILIY